MFLSTLLLGLLDNSYYAEASPKIWDEEWRIFLVNQLEILVNQFWKVGITEIFIGSFIEMRAHPNDIDGYFECDVHKLATGEIGEN